MSRKKIISLYLILTLVLGLNTSLAYAKENNKILVSVQYYDDKQIDTKILLDKAERGEVVNNEFTQTDVSTQEDGKIKITTVNKKLNRKIYSNGEVVDSYSMVAYITQSFTIIGTGSKEETGTSGSITVQLAVGMDYEKATPDGGVSFCYKVTKVYATPTLLDSSFTMTNLYQWINGSGVGYDASGNPLPVNEGIKSYNISYPANGTKYSLNTGYKLYILPVTGSGVGTSATLTYIRSSTGNTYTYTYSVSIGG